MFTVKCIACGVERNLNKVSHCLNCGCSIWSPKSHLERGMGNHHLTCDRCCASIPLDGFDGNCPSCKRDERFQSMNKYDLRGKNSPKELFIYNVDCECGNSFVVESMGANETNNIVCGCGKIHTAASILTNKIGRSEELSDLEIICGHCHKTYPAKRAGRDVQILTCPYCESNHNQTKGYKFEEKVTGGDTAESIAKEVEDFCNAIKVDPAVIKRKLVRITTELTNVAASISEKDIELIVDGYKTVMKGYSQAVIGIMPVINAFGEMVKHLEKTNK